MTVQFNVIDIERSLPNGVVTQVHWRAAKQEGEQEASIFGSIGVPFKDPSDPTFVPFDELTHDQVVQWMLSKMGEEEVDEIEAILNAQIDAIKNPTNARGTPW